MTCSRAWHRERPRTCRRSRRRVRQDVENRPLTLVHSSPRRVRGPLEREPIAVFANHPAVDSRSPGPPGGTARLRTSSSGSGRAGDRAVLDAFLHPWVRGGAAGGAARGSRHRPHRRAARPGDDRSALRIAETGHLTFATLHTNSAAQTINRIIDVFPAHQQGQIRTQLSLVLEGIVCQALLPRADGKGGSSRSRSWCRRRRSAT